MTLFLNYKLSKIGGLLVSHSEWLIQGSCSGSWKCYNAQHWLSLRKTERCNKRCQRQMKNSYFQTSKLFDSPIQSLTYLSYYATIIILPHSLKHLPIHYFTTVLTPIVKQLETVAFSFLVNVTPKNHLGSFYEQIILFHDHETDYRAGQTNGHIA